MTPRPISRNRPSRQAPTPAGRDTDGRQRLTLAIVGAIGCLLAIAACLALAACGSSGKSGSGSGSAAASVGVRYADCMRVHGVPNFPDPSGGGVQLSGSGIDTQSPAFQSAQKACQKLMPGALGGRPETRGIDRGVKLAECMRAHGLTFPDPTASPPSTPAAGGMLLGGPDDGFFPVPASMVQSPAFKHAAATCGFPTFGPTYVTPVAAPGG